MTVSLRTKAREFAMQMLFQWEMSPQDPRKLEMKFWKSATASEDTEEFANQLFEGAVRTVKDLDAAIEKHCVNWRFDRIAAIDRAILRLAAYELAISETPARAVINEAVELAKKFSGEDSGAFVNGVLDAVNKSRKETTRGSGRPA
jgi:N utilization substance protein B